MTTLCNRVNLTVSKHIWLSGFGKSLKYYSKTILMKHVGVSNSQM
jgi:hypothetical protein